MALGQQLNVQQRLATKHSLKKIALNENLDDLVFWGKITGVEKDYLIAKSTTCSTTITKSFYVSNDGGLSFSKLPDADDFVAGQSSLIYNMFSGNPAKTYKDPNRVKKLNEDGEEEEEDEEEEEEEEEEDEEEEGAPKKVKERKLTEVERLAWTVGQLDRDCALIAKGCLTLTPTGDIVRTGSKGRQGSEKIDDYYLYRSPVDPETLMRVRKAGVSNNDDFLDRPSSGQPQGVWVVRSDPAGGVSIRNLQWLGFEHSDGQNQYFGNGLKNNDVMFMI